MVRGGGGVGVNGGGVGGGGGGGDTTHTIHTCQTQHVCQITRENTALQVSLWHGWCADVAHGHGSKTATSATHAHHSLLHSCANPTNPLLDCQCCAVDKVAHTQPTHELLAME